MESVVTKKDSEPNSISSVTEKNKINDVSDSFSRRGEKVKGAVGTTQSSSAFGDETKQIPAWLRKKNEAPADKYDKYGTRERNKPEETTDSSTAASSAGTGSGFSDDRYSKYISRDQSSNGNSRIKRTEDSRVKRRRESDSDNELLLLYANRRREHGASGLDEENIVIASYAKPVTSNIPSTNQYKQFRSHIENRHEKDINSIVRSHYNQKTYHSRSVGSRAKSPIYKLRNFNNTIKYILLGNFVKKNPDSTKPTTILDLCCGKGGDLNKVAFVGANQLIGIDISDASITEAFKRYSENKARFIPNHNSKGARDSRKYDFEACFATGDCFTASIPDILEPNFPGIINNLFPVDCVSVQFALHYAFETEEKVKTLLNNVSKSLRPGGVFIGTIPLSDFIKEKIVKKEYKNSKFGNDLYSVTFHKEPPVDGVFRPPFGNGYNFSLTDAIDDVPEYVVPFEVLRLMCEDYGLILKYKKNFVDLFNQEIPKYFGRLNKNLIEGMKRSDGKYGAEGSEKEAVAFYLGFVFEKVGA